MKRGKARHNAERGMNMIAAKFGGTSLADADAFRRVAAIVQDQPEKQKELRKFISYYLPTSMKLLHNYQQMDAQGIEGKNISEAKQQIEETMDTMISAFERQLDALFSTENMDVSADIAAMQNLMKADGLIENELTDKIDKLQ